MTEIFDASLEKILENMQTTRSKKRLFAYEMLIEKRIQQQGGTPVIEGDTAFFFDRNESGEDISITGDWNGWKHGVDVMKATHPSSKFHYLKKKFAIDSRLSYRFLSEEKGSFNDPLNPNTLQEVFGNNTYLVMPGYKHPAYMEKPGRSIPKGVVKFLNVSSSPRDNFSRELAIYIPNGMRLRGKAAFLYVHDGLEAMTIGRFTDILDNLFYHEPHTKKVIVVFVPPVDRHAEYMMNPKFAKWMAKDMVPQVEKFLRVSSAGDLRTVMGASLGGLIAAYTGLLHSKIFGNVVAQSASFWYDEKSIIKHFSNRKKLPIKFYIHTGTIFDALEGSRDMLKALQLKGYDITFRETNESHNWGNWSAKYAEIVRWCGAMTAK